MDATDMAEQFTRLIEILTATPGGTLALIILFLALLILGLMGIGFLLILWRMANNVSQQEARHAKYIANISTTYASQAQDQRAWLRQLTTNALQHSEAVDKVGDALETSNKTLKTAGAAINELITQNTALNAMVNDQHADLLTVTHALASDMSLVREDVANVAVAVGAVNEGVNHIAATVNREHNQIGDISTVMGGIKNTVSTLHDVMTVIASEIKDLGVAITALDRRLEECQDTGCTPDLSSGTTPKPVC